VQSNQEQARDDSHMIQMAVEGDQDALDTLFRQYRAHLYLTALRLCGNPEEAEDALQDGLFSAFRHLRKFQGRSRFSTWLTRIVINATFIRMRQRSRRVVISVDERASKEDEPYLADVLRDMSPDPETMYARKEALELVRRRLQNLPQPYLKILWLRDIQGFTIEETANALGVSRNTIKSTLHRAHAKLAGLAATSKADLEGRTVSEDVACGAHLESPPRETFYAQGGYEREMVTRCI
jgi:RNA polymerase sigma-70 factor (ECF subfamily)